MRDCLRLFWRYPVATALFVLVCYLSLFFLPPHTRLSDVAFIDKWTHIVMYGGSCLVLWWEYWRQHSQPNWRRLLLLAWLAPVGLGAMLELLQEYCTGGRRSGEWLDLAANTTGVTLATLLGPTLLKRMLRKG